MISLALAAGASAGAILLFLSHVAPSFGAGNFIRDLDEPRVFGRELSRREAHFLGALLHLVLSAVFGGIYAYLVEANVVGGFDLAPIIGWGLVLAIFTGGVILPLEGHGVFGFKEDAWFPIDLLVTNLAWAFLFWMLMLGRTFIF